MKASEIRIGNLAQDIHGRTILISEIKERTLRGSILPTDHNSMFIIEDEIQPIPLTEEWYNRLTRSDDFGMVWIYSSNSLWVFHKGVVISVLHSVHEYQNLYFALTGKELIVKEEKK